MNTFPTKMRFRYLRNVQKYLKANDVEKICHYAVSSYEMSEVRLAFAAFGKKRNCSEAASYIGDEHRRWNNSTNTLQAIGNPDFQNVGRTLASCNPIVKNCIDRNYKREIIFKGTELDIEYMLGANLSAEMFDSACSGVSLWDDPAKDHNSYSDSPQTQKNKREFEKGIFKADRVILMKYFAQAQFSYSKDALLFYMEHAVPVLKYYHMRKTYLEICERLNTFEQLMKNIKTLKDAAKESLKTFKTLEEHLPIWDTAQKEERHAKIKG